MKSETTPPFYDGHHYDPACSVGYQLMQLMQLMKREADQRMAAFELTDAQWKPLWMLHRGVASTPNELARELDMDAGALTRLLDRLEAKALITRERSETDRRVVLLGLTDAGRAVAGQVPVVLAGVNNDFLQGFSEAEWQQLQDLLSRMTSNGRALAAGGTDL